MSRGSRGLRISPVYKSVTTLLQTILTRCDEPCSLVHSSVPWKRVGRSSHQYLAGRQQLHPIETPISTCPLCSHRPSITYHSEILKWSRSLNVLQSLLQILQLQVHTTLGLLCVLDSLSLESLNGLDLPSYIICDWLEGAEMLLELVDDGLVLEEAAVVCEVDLLGLF